MLCIRYRTKRIILLFFILPSYCMLYGRSIHRPKDPHMSYITTRWDNDNITHTLREPHLTEYPLFKVFDKDYFYDHLLPTGNIFYRHNPKLCIDSKELSQLIEHLLSEIAHKKTKFTHFTVLRKRNFHKRKGCGLLIVKFKDYPFVLKVFIETPASFINPYCKGLEPTFFYFMGGGINRHVAGFTRIKNLDYLKQEIEANAYLSSHIDVPRKWYWIPHNLKWIEITGTNIGPKKNVYTKIPATYCIISDAIDHDPQVSLSLFKKNDRKMILKFCNLMNNRIDPHIDNFIVEKGTNKFVIIDTEHFPTIVGLKKRYPIKSYFSWYTHLAFKCVKDIFLYTKKGRREIYSQQSELELL